MRGKRDQQKKRRLSSGGGGGERGHDVDVHENAICSSKLRVFLDDTTKTRKGIFVSTFSSSPSSSEEESRDVLLCEEKCVEDEDEGEKESVFGWLSSDVLFLILRYTQQQDRSSVARVCKRWDAIGRVAFNEFETAKSFVHALFVDRSRLTRMGDNPRLTDALAKNDDILEAVCKKVTLPHLLKRWLSNLSDTRWMSCLSTSIACGNTAAIGALFVSPPPMLSVQQKAEAIVTRTLSRKGTSANTLACLLGHLRTLCPGFIEKSSFFAVTCCFHKQDDLLMWLLEKDPDVFAPGQLLYILNHAADQRNQTMVNLALAAPRASEIVVGQETLYLAKKLCKLGWTHAASRLLPASSVIEASSTTTTATDLTVLLRHAAIAGMLPTVRMLLGRRDVNPGMRRNIIVREAMELGHKQVVLALLSDPRVFVLDATSAETSLLCCAMRSGQDKDVIQCIVEAVGKTGDACVAFVSQFDHAPVRLAIKSSNKEGLAALYSLCPDMPLTREEVLEILELIGGTSEYADMASRIIHDRRFARYFEWNK